MKKRIILIFTIVGALFLGGCDGYKEERYLVDYIRTDGTTGSLNCRYYTTPWMIENKLYCNGKVADNIQSISYKVIKTEN